MTVQWTVTGTALAVDEVLKAFPHKGGLGSGGVSVSLMFYGNRKNYTKEGSCMKRRSVPKSTALVLAVSLWIAGGGVASAQDTVINEDYYGTLYDNDDDSSNNTLTVNNATVYGSVNGGVSSSADVTGNTVTLNGATVMEGVCGGSAIQGTVKGNTVIATNSKINNLVYGGFASSGTATGNTVTLKGTTVNGTVFGGSTPTGGDAMNNTVRLINTTINGDVFGGYQYSGSGNVTNNTIRLINTTISGDVFGGYKSKDTGDASGNTVRLTNSTVLGSVYGGHKNVGAGDVVTGNTLNLLGANTVQGDVKNFETINIRHARWGTPALTANAITNAGGVNPNISAEGIIFTGASGLTSGQSTALIHANTGDYARTISGTNYRAGTTLEGTGHLSKSADNKDIIYTVDSVGIQEQTHNALMGAGAGMATLAAGNDFIGAATEGLSQAANVGADGVSSYAQMGGGSIRQETGSHIDVKSWNAVLALGRKNEKPRGTFEYGAFFEYGRGNYTTYNGDLRGDGFTYYTGGGLLAKYTVKGGAYVEGSLRVGSVHGETRSVMLDENDEPYNCDVDAPYWGLHLGVGKEFALKNGDSVDVYGRFFLNRRNSTSFDMGGHYDLDALTSKVIRVGARYTLKRGGKWNYYGGLAYEHELDGKARGTADGFAIRGTDTSGGSLRAEIGATIEPDVKSPWKLDLNLAGFAGKKRGLTGGVSVAWMF